jgi:hypothetical protein
MRLLWCFFVNLLFISLNWTSAASEKTDFCRKLEAASCSIKVLAAFREEIMSLWAWMEASYSDIASTFYSWARFTA